MRADTATAIRARLLAAMQQRAADLDGAARGALDARAAELGARDAAAATDTPAASTPPTALRELLDQLAHAHADTPARAAYPELPALADLRQLWAELRSDRQLRQAVVHAPADAGPLNSAALASRAIALMRERSPGYLRAFLAYVDELAWLQQLGQPAAAATPAPRKRANRKRQG